MIDLNNSFLILIVSGVAFFLFGLSLASHSLEKLMAGKISGYMNRLSENNLLAIVVGVSMATLLQSSGAVTSMLVGLGSARVINLRQVMGVIIGTAIGSTLTVQIMSLHLYEYSLPIFTIAFIVYFKTKKNFFKNIAQVFIGFALLFIGLRMITTSTQHFVENPLLTDIFQGLKANPIYSLLFSIVFCALVQSSAVTIGLAMSLASVNAITFHDAMLWVYGANIGTTSIAIMAASGSNHIGRQVAWAHFFYKTASVVIFFPFTSYFINFLNFFGAGVSRAIANGHLIFNIISAIIFFPFINKGASFIERLFPKNPEENFGAEFVTLNNYQNAALATSYAHREIMRTADIVLNMIKDSIKLFESNDSSLMESFKERDHKVDFLYRETKMFLIDHANRSNTVVHQKVMQMIMFLSDLERAADSIDINIIALAIKRHALKLEFSPEGWEEIKTLHSEVCKVAAIAINAFQNPVMCDDVIKMKRELAKLENTLREHHIERLNRGLVHSINTSSIHLDLLSEYRRISSLLCNHAYSNKSD